MHQSFQFNATQLIHNQDVCSKAHHPLMKGHLAQEKHATCGTFCNCKTILAPLAAWLHDGGRDGCVWVFGEHETGGSRPLGTGLRPEGLDRVGADGRACDSLS